MKFPLLIGLGICLAASPGCVTSPQVANTAVRPAGMANLGHSEAARLLVISAVYGSGDKFADVTYRVNDLLREPKAYFWAKPEWLEADPTPGWNKALVIVYEWNGRRQVFSTGEGGTVSVARLRANVEKAPTPGKEKAKKREKARKSSQ